MAKSKTKKKAPARTRAKAKPAKKKPAAKRTSAPSARSKSRAKPAKPKKPAARTRKETPRHPSSRSAKTRGKPAQATPEEPQNLVPVPLPGVVHASRAGDTSERSAHLDKLKQLFESAPVSRYLGMSLGYCENGVARVRLPFRKDFVEGHGVIHGGLIGLLGDTAGNFAVGSVSPGSTVKTVEFKLSLLSSVQGDLLAIGEVVRKGRTLATCRLEVVEGNDRVVAIGLATYALQAV